LKLLAAALVLVALPVAAQEVCTGPSCTANGATKFEATTTGASVQSNFESTTGTLQATATAPQYGTADFITSAGSGTTYTQTGRLVYLLPGYTGTAGTRAAFGYNQARGTAHNWATASNNAGHGNGGVVGQADGPTLGTNFGLHGDGRNTGGGDALGGALLCESGAHCIGIGAQAVGGTIKVGGFLGVNAANLPTESAALVTDTGFGGEPTYIGKGLGLTVMKVSQAGAVQEVTYGARPTCDASTRTTRWVTRGGPGVADTVEWCLKDAADAYSWVP